MKATKVVLLAALTTSVLAVRQSLHFKLESEMSMEHELKQLLMHGINNTAKDPTVPKSARIAVVGAGPGGLHMASRLGKLGYKSVTVLEKTGRVGGKSFTLYRDLDGNACEQRRDPKTGKVNSDTCVPHEMGTCYLHNGYHHIRHLVEDYDLTPGIAPDGRALFNDLLNGAEISEFVASEVARLISEGKVPKPSYFPWGWSEGLTTMKVLVDAVKKYNKLNDRILGKVAFTMPARLSTETLAEIDMPFGQWLEANGLHALVGFLGLAQTAQGYGYVHSIPTYYGLVWMRPEVLNGFLQQSLHMKVEKILGETSWYLKWAIRDIANFIVGGDARAISRITTMLPEGYAKIWKRMHEKDNINVRFHVEIESIDRQLHDEAAPVKITFSEAGSKSQTEEFDVLVYTAPHGLAHSFVKDIAAEEQRIFEGLSPYVLMTTLYKGAPVPGYSTSDAKKTIFYDTKALVDKKSDGDLYCDRDAHRIFANHDGPVQERVSYQFYEDPCAVDKELCNFAKFPRDSSPRFDQIASQKERLVEDLTRFQATNLQIQEQFPWPYFWHFSLAGLKEGLPWDLLAMQGQRKTFWLGASAIFESVHDVTNYNLMVLDQHFGAVFRGDGELWFEK